MLHVLSILSQKISFVLTSSAHHNLHELHVITFLIESKVLVTFRWSW